MLTQQLIYVIAVASAMSMQSEVPGIGIDTPGGQYWKMYYDPKLQMLMMNAYVKANYFLGSGFGKSMTNTDMIIF